MNKRSLLIAWWLSCFHIDTVRVTDLFARHKSKPRTVSMEALLILMWLEMWCISTARRLKTNISHFQLWPFISQRLPFLTKESNSSRANQMLRTIRTSCWDSKLTLLNSRIRPLSLCRIRASSTTLFLLILSKSATTKECNRSSSESISSMSSRRWQRARFEHSVSVDFISKKYPIDKTYKWQWRLSLRV